jgi:hypothetical protein
MLLLLPRVEVKGWKAVAKVDTVADKGAWNPQVSLLTWFSLAFYIFP